MNFINSKSFQRNDPKAFELRKIGFRANFRILFFVLALANVTILAFNCFPLFEDKKKFMVPLYFPIDFHEQNNLYYGVYVCMMFCSWVSGSGMCTGLLFASSLIGFLSNEFRILGAAYDKIFREMDDMDEKSEEYLEIVHAKLRENAIQHSLLLELVLHFCKYLFF